MMGVVRTGDLSPSPIKRLDGSKIICTRNLKTIKRQVEDDFRRIKDEETISTRNLDANGKLKHIIKAESIGLPGANDIEVDPNQGPIAGDDIQEQQPRRRGRPSRG